MHCDLVHLSSKATLWVPFTRLALVPELCSSVTFLDSMGLSKANELLLLGKQITAQKAYEWNICSKVVDVPGTDNNNDEDPFHPSSLASKMCDDIRKSLLSLPRGGETAQHFVRLVKGGRRCRMEQILRDELVVLDGRFDSGDVQEAAQRICIGSSSTKSSKGSRSQQQRSRL